MNCKFDCITNIGGRENNEDSMLTEKYGDEYLFAVADGLGGHDCGEIASALAVDKLKELFTTADKFDLAEAMQAANTAVFDEQRKTGKLMRTTLVAAHVQDNKVIIAHAGDTRGYVFRNGTLYSRTLDHSASQLAVHAGEITPDQIRHHPDRNVLTNVLGGYESLRPEITVLMPNKNDAILLCSDGFWEYVLEEDMISCLNRSLSPKGWIRKMVKIRQQKAPKDSDNNTAVAVFFKIR